MSRYFRLHSDCDFIAHTLQQWIFLALSLFHTHTHTRTYHTHYTHTIHTNTIHTRHTHTHTTYTHTTYIHVNTQYTHHIQTHTHTDTHTHTNFGSGWTLKWWKGRTAGADCLVFPVQHGTEGEPNTGCTGFIPQNNSRRTSEPRPRPTAPTPHPPSPGGGVYEILLQRVVSLVYTYFNVLMTRIVLQRLRVEEV